MRAVKWLIALFVPLFIVAVYFAIFLNWSYSTGERAGWICKTWEGEMAMVSMPGSMPEKFYFTIHDDAVAAKLNKAMGKRVVLHYSEKVGLPTSCFGDTRYFVTDVRVQDEGSPAPDAPAPGASGASAAGVQAPVAP